MWFNNTLIYQYELDESVELSTLLADDALKPCPPHARFIYGWMPVFSDAYAFENSDYALICMGKEERVLPRSVINRLIAERAQAFEDQHGRALKRAEKAQMAEDLEFELLPKAFCLQKRLNALFDHSNKRLIINTSSTSQASQLIGLLRKSVPNIRIEPLPQNDNLATRFANWIMDPASLPPMFQLASDCLLFALDDEKKRFTCKGYELPADEVLSLLSQGLAVAEISIIWNERIQLTLTQDFTFKRLKCLDYLVDEFNDLRDVDDEAQQQDAALTLLTGELRSLTNDLQAALTIAASKKDKLVVEEVCAE